MNVFNSQNICISWEIEYSIQWHNSQVGLHCVFHRMRIFLENVSQIKTSIVLYDTNMDHYGICVLKCKSFLFMGKIVSEWVK